MPRCCCIRFHTCGERSWSCPGHCMEGIFIYTYLFIEIESRPSYVLCAYTHVYIYVWRYTCLCMCSITELPKSALGHYVSLALCILTCIYYIYIMCVYLYLCMCRCAHLCMYMCVCMCMLLTICICLYTHKIKCIQTVTYGHIYIHKYICISRRQAYHQDLSGHSSETSCMGNFLWQRMRL